MSLGYRLFCFVLCLFLFVRNGPNMVVPGQVIVSIAEESGGRLDVVRSRPLQNFRRHLATSTIGYAEAETVGLLAVWA